MVNFAKQGRARYSRTPLGLPPYEPDESYDWISGTDFLLPHASPPFFLQFAVVIKRFRNWLDWLREEQWTSKQCCNLTRMDSCGIEEWYPQYWDEWDLQKMQWNAPYDYGSIWMFDWESPSPEKPDEFHGLEELLAPPDESGG